MIAISRTGRLLRQLVRVSCARPVLTVLLSVLFAVAGIAYTLHALTFKTSGRDVLPQSAPYVKRYVEYAKNFGELEDIVVVVEARVLRGRQGLCRPPRAGAARLSRQVRARLLPDRPQAVRGQSAPVPDHGRAQGDPRQDLRPPGVHGELRGGSEPGPPARRRQYAAGRRLRLQPLRPRAQRQGPARRHALPAHAPRADRGAPRSARAVSIPVGHPLFLRERGAGRRLLPLRGQEPALHPGRVAQGGQGSFLGDQKSIEAVRGAIAKLRPSFPAVRPA